MDWAFGYMQYYGMNTEYVTRYKSFYDNIVQTIANYKLPVIRLDKSTLRDAVCKMFENVNKRETSDVFAINDDWTINYVGWAGHLAFASATRIGNKPLIRVNYEKYLIGNKDYLI